MNNGTKEQCEYCSPSGEFIGITDYDKTRLFLWVTGSYIQLFDENYPGMIDNHKIKFCPMCGRSLE